MFQARNVDLRGLQSVEGGTFRWGGRYHLDMNTRDTLFTELGVFADFSPALPADYCSADVVFLANIQPQLQLDVLRQTDGTGSVKLRALDTMNLWIDTARDDLTRVMRGVDLVLIAEDEARDYANTPSLRVAARHIFSLGPKLLVIKQGSYGALLFGADGSFFAAPAYPLEDVRDPTGAGDAFAGGFLGYLASRLTRKGSLSPTDYRRALIHGNIMGSYACEQFGVECIRGLTPDADQRALRRIRRLHPLRRHLERRPCLAPTSRAGHYCWTLVGTLSFVIPNWKVEHSSPDACSAARQRHHRRRDLRFAVAPGGAHRGAPGHTGWCLSRPVESRPAHANPLALAHEAAPTGGAVSPHLSFRLIMLASASAESSPGCSSPHRGGSFFS